MSTLTATATDAAPSTATRRRVTWRDHVWLTWHRQGGAILAVGFLALVLLLLLLHAEHVLSGIDQCLTKRCDYGRQADAKLYGDVVLRAVQLAPLVIALFWGVPVVSREVELRTATLAWSQDVSPRRWLAGRVAVLVALTVVVSGVLSWAAAALTRTMSDPPPNGRADGEPVVFPASGFESAFNTRPFELLAPMTVVYSVAGLLIGVAVGVLVKQTLPAIAIVTVTLVSVRLAVAHLWRPRFQEPERLLQPASNASGRDWTYLEPPPDSLVIDPWGYVDRDGSSIGDYGVCTGMNSGSKKWERCLDEGGYQQQAIYQPPDRIDVFQWIEVGIFVAVGVAALALAFALLRGRRVWV